MNAAIRAVTRSAIYNGFTVKGIMRGFKGLVFNEIVEFKSQSVSNIIQLGGTILKTARSEEFKTVEGRKAAYDNMVAAGIDALVVIGGDGSLTGAGLFAEEYNVPIVGLPGTIDNDLGGTDSTIGYDTALNTIMESGDKMRGTAARHSTRKPAWRTPRSCICVLLTNCFCTMSASRQLWVWYAYCISENMISDSVDPGL